MTETLIGGGTGRGCLWVERSQRLVRNGIRFQPGKLNAGLHSILYNDCFVKIMLYFPQNKSGRLNKTTCILCQTFLSTLLMNTLPFLALCSQLWPV
jgi:hypothetical protein